LAVANDSRFVVRVGVIARQSKAVPGRGSHSMADDTHPAYSSRAAMAAAQRLGLNPEWGERIATGLVVSAAVMIVALIAVLMGMD
jgi:hypothetical protein